jgi:hypothetical protein
MNVPSDPLQRSRTFHFLQREALVVKQRFVGVKQGAVFVQDKKMLRKEIYQLPKLLFVLTELCLSALQVIDVSVRSIPVDNVARFVAQRLSPKQEPSIHSVEPAQPSLNLTRLARREKSEPLICYFLQVLRVNGLPPSPARAASGVRPVYSCHRRFQNIPVPSGKLHQASVGIVSMIFRSFASEFRISSKALLNASCDRSPSIAITAI